MRPQTESIPSSSLDPYLFWCSRNDGWAALGISVVCAILFLFLLWCASVPLVANLIITLCFSVVSGALGLVCFQSVKTRLELRALQTTFIERVDDNIPEVLEQFFQAHDVVFQDVYANYPKEMLELVLNEIAKTYAHGEARRHGVTVFAKNVSIDSYAAIARFCLGLSHESVFSTTFIPNDLLAATLMPDDAKVGVWLAQVNKWLASPPNGEKHEVTRVHIFSERPGEQDQYGFAEFQKIYSAGPAFGQKYHTLFAAPGVGLYGYARDKVADPLYFGEYIVFDGRIALMYSSMFNHLALHFGGIATMMAESFKPEHRIAGKGFFTLDVSNGTIHAKSI